LILSEIVSANIYDFEGIIENIINNLRKVTNIGGVILENTKYRGIMIKFSGGYVEN
jgi:hypothetical protein